jgi:hypothetical protein
MPGPLGFPWGTFAALIVLAGSVVAAIVYAVAAGRSSGKGDGDE